MEFPYRVFRTPQGILNVYCDGELVCSLPPDFPQEHIRTLCHVHMEGMAAGERAAYEQRKVLMNAAQAA